MDGILIVDKPKDITSMEVVRRLKRASGEKRVGHGGTLDPIATGVVPVFFGHATRVMEYVVEGTKDYRGVVELGATTDTYDSEGEVTERRAFAGVAEEDVRRALESFRGVIQQVPPMYSALKRQGKRLYDLARAGIEVPREPRAVEVSRVEIVSFTPPTVTIAVGCGRGFYMRSFAHDLGQRLGCGAHLRALVRLRSGPFRIEHALSLVEAEQLFADGGWKDALLAPDAALAHLPAAIVGQRLANLIEHGRTLPLGLHISPSRPDQQCRAYSVDGRFLAVLALDASSRQWQPRKVFAGRERQG